MGVAYLTYTFYWFVSLETTSKKLGIKCGLIGTSWKVAIYKLHLTYFSSAHTVRKILLDHQHMQQLFAYTSSMAQHNGLVC